MTKNLSRKISNKDVAAIVVSVIGRYGQDEDLRAAVMQLLQFAAEHELGSWRRARFATEIAQYISTHGLTADQAVAFGAAFGQFIERDVETAGMHWNGYAAGVDGALRHCVGWEMSACLESGFALIAEGAGNPAGHASLLRAYELGWQVCGDKHVASAAARALQDAYGESTQSVAAGVDSTAATYSGQRPRSLAPQPH